MIVATGAVSAAAGVTVISAGRVADVAGVLAVSAGVGIVATGAVASAAGALAVSALSTVATGAVEFAGDVLGGSAGVVTGAMDAAADTAQCSEIIFSSVTERLLSAGAELAPLALCPISVTSWLRCGLRSTLLVVILKMWPVLSSATV
jgi:hypothetical protein